MGDDDGDTTTPGTDGYLSDNDGYRSVDGEAIAPRDEEPFWHSLGFSSLEDYLEDVEEGWRRLMPRWADPPARDLPAPGLPGDGAAVPTPQPEARTRQVGIKLRSDDYERLVRAARLYGVRPSTLARMLVAHGARAALDAEEGDG